MRILMIHPHDVLTFPWTIRIVKLAEMLANKGCEVTLCYIPNGQRRNDGISVRENLPDCIRWVELAEEKSSLAANVRKVVELGKSADVIHVQKCFMTAALPGIVAARLRNLPLHYDWDDDETDLARFWLSRVNRWKIAGYERIMPKLAVTVSTASAWLRDKALRFGAIPENIFDVPVGADLKEFDKLKNRPVLWPPATAPIKHWLVFVGHLEKAHYGNSVLNEFAAIASTRPDVGLLIVGGGGEHAQLEQRVADMGLSTRVFITGYVTHDDIPAILSKVDIGIACLPDTPFTRAGSPVKVLEYMAAGLPVVGTAVGESIRMLAGCGILVPAGKSGAIRDAVIDLLDDPGKRETLKRQARMRVAESYSWELSTDNLLAAYKRALSVKAMKSL